MHVHGIPGKESLNAWRYYQFANDISYRADIGPGLRLVHVVGIVIGGRARIGSHCTIFNDVTVGQKSRDEKAMPIIGDNVSIGSAARLIGGIEIGDGATIGTMTLVNKSVPPYSIAYGIPPNFTISGGVDRPTKAL
jgi:serine O-acetyltransferase